MRGADPMQVALCVLATSTGILAALFGGTFWSVQHLRNNVQVIPTKVNIDASEELDRSRVFVDADVLGLSGSHHGIKLRSGRCELRHVGAPLLDSTLPIPVGHLTEVNHENPEKLHMVGEIAPEFFHYVQAALRRNAKQGDQKQLTCKLLINFNLYKTGLVFRHKFEISSHVLGSSQGAKAWVVSSPRHVSWPNVHEHLHYAQSHRVVLKLPADEPMMKLIRKAQVGLKAGITLIDPTHNSTQISGHIESQVNCESKVNCEAQEGESDGMLLSVPVYIAGRVHAASLAKAVSAATSGSYSPLHARGNGRLSELIAEKLDRKGPWEPTNLMVLQLRNPRAPLMPIVGDRFVLSAARDRDDPAETAEPLLHSVRRVQRALATKRARHLSAHSGKSDALNFTASIALSINDQLLAKLGGQIIGPSPWKISAVAMFRVFNEKSLEMSMPRQDNLAYTRSEGQQDEELTYFKVMASMSIDEDKPSFEAGAKLSTIMVRQESEGWENVDKSSRRNITHFYKEGEKEDVSTEASIRWDGSKEQISAYMKLDMSKKEDRWESKAANQYEAAWFKSKIPDSEKTNMKNDMEKEHSNFLKGKTHDEVLKDHGGRRLAKRVEEILQDISEDGHQSDFAKSVKDLIDEQIPARWRHMKAGVSKATSSAARFVLKKKNYSDVPGYASFNDLWNQHVGSSPYFSRLRASHAAASSVAAATAAPATTMPGAERRLSAGPSVEICLSASFVNEFDGEMKEEGQLIMSNNLAKTIEDLEKRHKDNAVTGWKTYSKEMAELDQNVIGKVNATKMKTACDKAWGNKKYLYHEDKPAEFNKMSVYLMFDADGDGGVTNDMTATFNAALGMGDDEWMLEASAANVKKTNTVTGTLDVTDAEKKFPDKFKFTILDMGQQKYDVKVEGDVTWPAESYGTYTDTDKNSALYEYLTTMKVKADVIADMQETKEDMTVTGEVEMGPFACTPQKQPIYVRKGAGVVGDFQAPDTPPKPIPGLEPCKDELKDVMGLDMIPSHFGEKKIEKVDATMPNPINDMSNMFRSNVKMDAKMETKEVIKDKSDSVTLPSAGACSASATTCFDTNKAKADTNKLNPSFCDDNENAMQCVTDGNCCGDTSIRKRVCEMMDDLRKEKQCARISMPCRFDCTTDLDNKKKEEGEEDEDLPETEVITTEANGRKTTTMIMKEPDGTETMRTSFIFPSNKEPTMDNLDWLLNTNMEMYMSQKDEDSMYMRMITTDLDSKKSVNMELREAPGKKLLMKALAELDQTSATYGDEDITGGVTFTLEADDDGSPKTFATGTAFNMPISKMPEYPGWDGYVMKVDVKETPQKPMFVFNGRFGSGTKTGTTIEHALIRADLTDADGDKVFDMVGDAHSRNSGRDNDLGISIRDADGKVFFSATGLADQKEVGNAERSKASLSAVIDGEELFTTTATFLNESTKATAELKVVSDGEEQAVISSAMARNKQVLSGSVNMRIKDVEAEDLPSLDVEFSEGFIDNPLAKVGCQQFHLNVGFGMDTIHVKNWAKIQEAPGTGDICLLSDHTELKEDGKQLAMVTVDMHFPYEWGATTSAAPTQTVTEEQKVTKFSMDLALSSATATFDEAKAKEELAKSMGVAAEKVVIEQVIHKVEVTYSFSATITNAQAKKSIAEAHNVAEPMVEVTITPLRRLTDRTSVGRRLAGVDVKAVIKADNEAAAKAIHTSAGDATKVTQKLQDNGVASVTATVKEVPKRKVEVKTRVVNDGDSYVEPPDNTQLASIGNNLGGTAQVTQVVKEATAITTTPFMGTANSASGSSMAASVIALLAILLASVLG